MLSFIPISGGPISGTTAVRNPPVPPPPSVAEAGPCLSAVRLVITLDGVSTEFVSPGHDGPYPWLSRFGGLLLEARAGHLDGGVGTRESARMTFELDNIDRQAATLLGRPLRAQAVAYDDDGNELLSGLVQSIAYGTTLVGTIEA